MARPGGKISRTSAGSLSWFKNVAKSLGYTSTDLIKTMTPSVGEFFSVNAVTTREMVTDLRDLRTRGNQISRTIGNQPHISMGKRALKNAISDIKSGKIYNKERQEAIYDDGFSMDGESEFGTISMDGFENNESGQNTTNVPSITVKTYQPQITKNSPIVKAMERHTSAIYQSAQVTNETNISLATNKMIMDHKNNTRMVKGLQTINDNLSLLVNFHSDSMSKYIGASLKYYEESLQAMNATIAELKRGNASYEQPARREEFDPVNSTFLAGGGLNAKGYMEMVKRNFKEQIDSNPILSQMGFMANDKDTLKFLAASPLSFLSTKIVTTLLPQFLQQSMKNVDNMFANFFPAMFMKFSRATTGSNNPILQAIGAIFGVNVQEKNHVDLSKYNKGPVPFTGKTEKAITEVIPGYLRKILAAVSGKEEMAFDYEEGRFKKVRDMKADFERRRTQQAVSSYDSVDDIKRRSEAFVFESREDRKAFNEKIDKFFVELTKQQGLVNPRLRKGKDGSIVDDLANVYDFDDPNMLRMFRQLILSMPKAEQMRMFGRDVMNAKQRTRRMMLEAEEDPSRYNANTIFNGLYDEKDFSVNSRSGKATYRGGIPGLVDKFNYTAVDYLRDIKMTLLQGIRVFGGTGGDGGGTDILSGHDKSLKSMQDAQSRFNRQKEMEEREQRETYSQSDIQRFKRQGRTVLSDSFDLALMSDEDMRNRIVGFDEEENRKRREGQKGGFGQFMGRLFDGKPQERYNIIRERVNEIMRSPAEMLKSVFDKIDNTMYSLVFGKSEDDSDTSFMAKTMSMMKERFKSIGAWIETRILNPLKENLFGKEGIITKLKDSDLFKNMKSRMKSIGDYMFGKADADGKRQGGLFADTANNLADMWDGAKYYFTGKGYTNRAGQVFKDNDKSVFGEMKSIFRSFKETTKTYLMGNKDDPENKEKGVLGGALDSLKKGFKNFGEAIFGTRTFGDKDANQTFAEMTAKLKERAPKSLSWGLIGGGASLFSGHLGLLGSLFLPGGPIGGAIVGTTLGFLSQSDKFKNWMFGQKDADGQRLGGVINKSTQEFLAKHKVAIMGGATLGVAKSMIGGFGLLPSFFLPGGPIGGAIMGIGTSLLIRSEAFQKMMFGEKDADGKRVGGIIGKMFGQDKKFKNIMGNVGAGTLGGAGVGLVASKLGLMGALLVPGGPIGGAIMGAAAGIALSSDRWKKALFGEWDEETGLRKGGMLGKFQNWFKLEVQEPMKLKFQEINLNIKEWFTRGISNPFQDAIAPLKQGFDEMMQKMQDMFRRGWEGFTTKIGDVFEKHVGQPFGKFMEERVMKPLKGFLSKIINGIGRVFGTLLASPFKALSSIAGGVQRSQEQRGLRQYIDSGWEDMGDFRGRRERGERMGLFRTKDRDGNVIGKGVFGRIGDMYFNKNTRQEAREGEHGASYAASERERIAARNAAQEEEFATSRAKLATQRERLAMHRRLGLKYDYENFDQNGANISRIYDIYQKVNKEGVVDGTGRKLADKLGISLDEILGEGADASNLTKAQKKKLSNAIKRGLRGGAAKSLLSSNNLFDDETAPEEATVEAVGDMSTQIVDTLKDESIRPEIQESNKHLSRIESLMERVARALGANDISIDGVGSAIGGSIGGRITTGLRNLNRLGQQATTAGGKLPSKVGRLFKGSKLLGKSTGDSGDIPSHASGLDNVPHDDYTANLHQGEMVIPADQANYIRKVFGLPQANASSATGPINSSNHIVNNLSTKMEGKDGIFGIMSTYLRTIAVAVHGQLDGVGSNVFKIRKILQNGYGISDSDITGSANKDRVGFMGKLRNIFFRPFDAIREKLTSGIKVITDKIVAFGEGVKNVTKAILMVPVNIAKGIWGFTKQLGNIAKETALSIAKIPLVVSKMALAGMNMMLEGLKAVGPAIGETLMGTARFFSGAMSMAGRTLAGFGQGLGNLLVKLGNGIGDVALEFGKMTARVIGSTTEMLTKSVTMITDFTFKTSQLILDGTFNMLTKVSTKLLDVGESLMQIVTSPLKFIAQGMNKVLGIKKQEVVVTGGRLDSVDTVHLVERVQIVERVEKEIPVTWSTDHFASSVKHASPVHVIIQEDHSRRNDPSSTSGDISSIIPGLPSGPKKSGAFNFLKDLEKLTESKEKQDERKSITDRLQDKIESKQAHVSRKTADYQLDILRNKEKEKFQIDSTTEQTRLLGQIAESTQEHKNSWLSIFGTKGILTAAILMALPFLKDIIGAVKNLLGLNDGTGGFTWGERQGPARTDADGSHIADAEQREDIIKTVAKGYSRYAAPVVKMGAKIAAPAVKMGTKLLSPVVQSATKSAASGLSKLGARMASPFARAGAAIGDSVAKTVGKSNTVKAAVVAGSIAANTVKETVSSDIAKIKKFIIGVFEKFFAMDAIKKQLGPNAGKAAKTIIGSITKAFTGDSIKRHLGRLSAAMIKTGAKTGASAATLGITDAAFATWDLTTGAFEAAHMFQVHGDTVDTKMRISASVTKALFGFFPIVSVLADVFSEITGVNLKEFVASTLYTALASTEKLAELRENQTAFKQEWEAYNEANGTELTLDAYNDKVNQTVGGRIGKAAKSAWGGVTSAARWVGDGAKNIGSGLWKGAKWVGQGIKQTGINFWNDAKTVGGWVGGGASKLWDATGGGLFKSFTDDERIKKNFNVTGDGTITSGMRLSSGLGKYANILSMGLLDTEDATKTIYGLGLKAKQFWDGTAEAFQTNIAEPISKTWNSVKEKISNITGEISRRTGEIWNGVKDITSKGWDNVKSSVNKHVDLVKGATSRIWEGTKDIASRGWENVKSTVNEHTDKIRSIASKTWGNIKDIHSKGLNVIKNTVTKHTDQIKTKASESWDTIRTTVGDGWNKLRTTLSDKLSPMIRDAGDKWGNIKKEFSDTWDAMGKSISDKWNDIKESISDFFGKIGGWFTGANNEADRALANNGFTVGGNGGFGRGDNIGGGFGEPATINGFKYFSQNDERWKNYNYDYSPQVKGKSSNPSLGYRGCGPTAMSMIVSQLTGEEYLPTQLAEYAKSGGYSTSAGTTWAYFPAMAKKFGLNNQVFNPQSNSNTLISNLQRGVPVILSGTRKKYAASESPFTTAGHFVVATGVKGNQIMINDPRGAKYSKAYDLNKVIKESKQAWSFTRGDGSVPLPAQTTPSDYIQSTVPKELTILDLFAKMSENFSLLLENVYGGTETGLDWGDENAGAYAASTSSGFSLDFVPKTVQDKILKKTIELTVGSESGGNYFYARNDTSSQTGKKISPSIGVLQWREGNARRLMNAIYQKMPNDSTAKYYATQVNWSDRSPWSSDQQSKLENFLKSNPTVVKQVQDQMLMDHVRNTNLAPVYQHGVNTGKIRDPRSIVMLGEFANTGPAHVKTFLNSYSKTNGAEFPHFLREFKSKSYWGQRPIYNSRISNVSAKLQNWDPEQGGYGEQIMAAMGCGGFGGEDLDTTMLSDTSSRIPSTGSTTIRIAANSRSIPSVPMEYRSSQDSRSQHITVNSGDDQMWRQMIQVLKEIAGNTGATNQGISKLGQNSNTVIATENNPNNVIVVNPQQGGSTVNQIVTAGNQAQNKKGQTDYNNAKRIASGRK